MRKYNDGQYSQFATDPLILAAIEGIAGDDILDDASKARRIWEEPTEDELAAIEQGAREHAEPGETLYWGHYSIRN